MQTVVWCGYDRDKIVTVIPGFGMTEPCKVTTDRGGYPNAGDGPYCKVRLDPIGINDGGAVQEFCTGYESGGMRHHAKLHSANQVMYYDIWEKWSSYGCYCYITLEAYEYFTSGTTTDWYVAARYLGKSTRVWGGWNPPPDEYLMSQLTIDDWDTSSWAIVNQSWMVQGGQVTTAGRNHLLTCDFIYPDYRGDVVHAFHSILDAGVWPGYYATRFAGAYSEACATLEGSQVNQLGTVLELSQTAVGLFSSIRDPLGSIISTLKGLADPREAWLSYRYSYTTTKLDIQDILELNDTIRMLKQLCEDSFALHKSVYDDGARFSATLLLPLQTVISGLTTFEAYGFDVSGADLWDIIPYSFIVDWFYSIGPAIERFERWGGSITIEPSEVWYSYFKMDNGVTQYMRVPGRRLEAIPTYTDAVTSQKTIRMRIADTISLFS